MRALQGASKLSDSELRRITSAHGDAGKSAREILEGRTKPEHFGLLASRDFFDALQRTRGPIAKAEILQKQLQRLSAIEGQYVVKILTSDLRIGLKEGLVEEAIARAFEAPLDEVKEANMLLGDIGATAGRAATGNLAGAELSSFSTDKINAGEPGADRGSHLGAVSGNA